MFRMATRLLLRTCCLYGVALLLYSGCLSSTLIAAAFYGTRLSWPVMVPSLQLGSFGGITKFLFEKPRGIV